MHNVVAAGLRHVLRHGKLTYATPTFVLFYFRRADG